MLSIRDAFHVSQACPERLQSLPETRSSDFNPHPQSDTITPHWRFNQSNLPPRASCKLLHPCAIAAFRLIVMPVLTAKSYRVSRKLPRYQNQSACHHAVGRIRLLTESAIILGKSETRALFQASGASYIRPILIRYPMAQSTILRLMSTSASLAPHPGENGIRRKRMERKYHIQLALRGTAPSIANNSQVTNRRLSISRSASPCHHSRSRSALYITLDMSGLPTVLGSVSRPP